MGKRGRALKKKNRKRKESRALNEQRSAEGIVSRETFNHYLAEGLKNPTPNPVVKRNVDNIMGKNYGQIASEFNSWRRENG